jgi:hypothetical protein
MDFGAMKRRELQALCKRHGLAGGGTNADLVARLSATLSVRTLSPLLPNPLLLKPSLLLSLERCPCRSSRDSTRDRGN